NWSIWATEDQSRQGQIPMLNITLRSLKEKGGPAGLLLLQPSLSRNRRRFYIIGDWSLAIVEETWSTYSFNLESMLLAVMTPITLLSFSTRTLRIPFRAINSATWSSPMFASTDTRSLVMISLSFTCEGSFPSATILER